MSISLSDIAILKVKNADYCCIISEICKSGAMKLFKKFVLIEKKVEQHKT